MGRGDGKGSEELLTLASNDFISNADGRLGSVGGFGLGAVMDSDGCEAPRGSFNVCSIGLFGSGALEILLLSLARLDLELAAVTVCALVGLAASLFSLASAVRSATGWGFRAWATARGPAHRGIMGSATLASTKLDSTATGRTFSLILS